MSGRKGDKPIPPPPPPKSSEMETKKGMIQVKDKKVREGISALRDAVVNPAALPEEISLKLVRLRGAVRRCGELREELMELYIFSGDKKGAGEVDDEQAALEMEFVEAEEKVKHRDRKHPQAYKLEESVAQPEASAATPATSPQAAHLPTSSQAAKETSSLKKEEEDTDETRLVSLTERKMNGAEVGPEQTNPFLSPLTVLVKGKEMGWPDPLQRTNHAPACKMSGISPSVLVAVNTLGERNGFHEWTYLADEEKMKTHLLLVSTEEDDQLRPYSSYQEERLIYEPTAQTRVRELEGHASRELLQLAPQQQQAPLQQQPSPYNLDNRSLVREQQQQSQQQQGSYQPPPVTPSTSHTHTFCNEVNAVDVPLQLLPVMIRGENGARTIIRAMMDSGSQKCYVTEDIARRMEFEVIGAETVVHHPFGGRATQPQTHKIVKIYIAGINGDSGCCFAASVIPTIARASHIPNIEAWANAFLRRGVRFPPANPSNSNIDFLIGNDVGTRLYTGNIEDLGCGPVAMETLFGWVLCGKSPHRQINYDLDPINVNIGLAISELSLTDLWDLELIGIRDAPATKSREELSQQTEEHFRNTVTRDAEGRYVVRLPFISGAQEALDPNSYAAERRLRSTVASLDVAGYLEKYSAIFEEWEQAGMIERVDLDKEPNWRDVGHYLPHRAVIKTSSATTPVRPVFDASAKAKGKASLNMSLDPGPNYLELIARILTLFRLNRFGVTADIKKAFQMISVAPEHRQHLRFLWYEDPKTKKKLRVYQHTRVVFGVNCSPFLLAAVLRHLLEAAPSTHQQTAQLLLRSLYVDNNASSLSSLEETLDFKHQCQELLLPAHFDLRGWVIGPTGEDKIEPLLGLQWSMQDFLLFDTAAAEEKMTGPATQRNVLALKNSLFDPLGMLSPFLLLAKRIMRRCHEAKLGWDKPLPAELEEDYRRWGNQIPLIREIRIPRYVQYDQASNVSFHCFSDASGDAYAAAVFLRCETPEGVIVSLMQAKTRIATKMMKITIPRLELVGCYIGVRLAATVFSDLGDPRIPITYYTDSSTALAWIQGEGPWEVFVNNRVKEIREHTHSNQWRHVRGKDNPADLPSRGCSASKLIEAPWWRGPQWLTLPPQDWPKTQSIVPDPEAVGKEKKKTVAININMVTDDRPMEKFLRYSSYAKITRMTAYWLRYRHILWTGIHDPDRVCPKVPHNVVTFQAVEKLLVTPSVEEIEHAERVIWRHVQEDLNEKNLRKLHPRKDVDGLLRTTSPIMFDEVETFNHPIILPPRNPFVERMLQEHHREKRHVGIQFLLALIRERYWLIHGKKTCKRIVDKCGLCRRFNARRLEVPEPPLPRARTATGVPFNSIGVDFTGPLTCKNGDKVWIALFTCAAYRAIHLEILDDMTTEELFVAFRAFANRRGKPKIVISDNGLNLVGANTALQKLYVDGVTKFAAEEQISWRFIPPLSPWWASFYERLIGIVKSLIRVNLMRKVVTRKELVGLLLEVEEACNNRPLTFLSESSNDPAPLTPNMMVRNSGLSYFPELDIRDASSARAAIKKIQRLRESLRTRFRSEYLGALQNRRAGGNFQPLTIGAAVLLEKDNEKRINWPMGTISKIIPGRDGFPRQYEIRLYNVQEKKYYYLERAAQRPFPMELDEHDEDDQAPTPNPEEEIPAEQRL